MASVLYQQVEQLSRDKGIDPQVVVSAIEDAILVATRKYYKTSEDLQAHLDKDTGEILVYAVKTVVDEVVNPIREVSLDEARTINPDAVVGGELLIRKPTEVLGRIAAQTAKQVIFQKVREAERDTVYNEYISRIGEIVNVMVKRIEGSDIVVDLGRTEARLPRREQSRLESFTVGERTRVIIRAVEKAIRGPQVTVSRADPLLVQRLFEAEVPEIYDGTVVIRGVAREAGERTKIAVYSRDKDVDCVGACVGMKGMRVQSIIRELRGEKIDIIEYSDDPVQFAANALSPAKVSRVSIISSEDRQLEVVVDDMQLSLAIGKKGQNVRLAAKLLGWKVDIKSEEEKRREVEAQMSALVGGGVETPLSDLADVLDPSILEALNQYGISTIEQLGGLTPEQLQEIPGVGEEAIERIFVAVNQFFGASLEGEVLPEEAAGGEELLAGSEDTDLDSSGQTLEAEQVRGMMEADAADVAEVPSDDGQGPAPDAAASRAGDLETDEEAQASEQSPEAEKQS